MRNLLKYLKSSLGTIVLIISLLVFQAVCDLSLPEYTSNIVNVGIQQGGIENAVPEAMRKSQLDNLIIFMTAEDRQFVLENYKLIDKNNITDNEYNKYLKKYPILKSENIYKLNTKDKDIIESLDKILSKSILILSAFQDINSRNLLLDGVIELGELHKGSNTIAIISNMSELEKNEFFNSIDRRFSYLPEAIISQSAIEFVKKEYSILGMNIAKIQSNYILKSGVVMLAIALLSMIATIAVAYFGVRVAASLGRNLRGKVFRKVVGFSNTELDKFSTASLITRSTNDIQQIQTLMVMLIRIVFYAPILGIGAVIKVLNTNISMSWIIGVAVFLIILLMLILFLFVMPKFKMLQKLVDKVNLVTREILSGILVIRAFSTEKHEENRFDKANRDLTKTNLFVTRSMAFMMPTMMLIMNAISILIVWKGAAAIEVGDMQVGDMMAFIQYTMQIIMSFLMISMVSITLPRAIVAAERIDEVLSTDFTIVDKKETLNFDKNKKGLIEFKNVSFRYPNADQNVLNNITFTANAGETTAFIGSTGAGKSTLINLVPRFYDVTDGEVLVDGINVKNVNQKDLREKIGYISQKAILFSGTIDSNLRYGKQNATEEQIKTSAKIAQAMEFIDAKPEKFNTEISQGGTNISGGQKQRLCIARALAKNPEILIFDDSFSALDLRTDLALRKAVSDKVLESTVLLVAQRVSTIINADKIIVLDQGKIVGSGTHSELMNSCEVYKQIALSQLSKEELCDD